MSFELGEVSPMPSFGSFTIQDLELGFIDIKDSAVPVWHRVERDLVVQMGFSI